MTTGTSNMAGGALADFSDELTSLAELRVHVKHAANAKHPELCAGIGGSSFAMRFAGFGGMSRLSAVTPDHIWVYTAVHEAGGLCDDAVSSQ
jgi:hypothetical protein